MSYSVAKLCLTFCNPIDCSMPGFPVPHYLPEFAQVSDAIQPSHPLSPYSFAFNQSLFQCSCQVFTSSIQIRWPKYWSFSFSISPSNEYSGLISFRIDWLNLQFVIVSKIFLIIKKTQLYPQHLAQAWHSKVPINIC